MPDERGAWVARVLGFEASVPKPANAAGLSLARLGKARLEWRDMLADARGQIGTLKRVIVADFEGEDEAAVPEALDALDRSIAALDDRLGDDLDAVLNADAERRAELIEKARATATGFASFLIDDTVMSLLDGNDLLPQTAVCRPLRRKLADIQSALVTGAAENA